MSESVWPDTPADSGSQAGSPRPLALGPMLRTSTPYPVVPRGRLDSPFFQSKFRIPNDPRHFVPRPRLLSLLDDLSDFPVTAIVAPAGSIALGAFQRTG